MFYVLCVSTSDVMIRHSVGSFSKNNFSLMSLVQQSLHKVMSRHNHAAGMIGKDFAGYNILNFLFWYVVLYIENTLFRSCKNIQCCFNLKYHRLNFSRLFFIQNIVLCILYLSYNLTVQNSQKELGQKYVFSIVLLSTPAHWIWNEAVTVRADFQLH